MTEGEVIKFLRDQNNKYAQIHSVKGTYWNPC